MILSAVSGSEWQNGIFTHNGPGDAHNVPGPGRNPVEVPTCTTLPAHSKHPQRLSPTPPSWPPPDSSLATAAPPEPATPSTSATTGLGSNSTAWPPSTCADLTSSSTSAASRNTATPDPPSA